MGRLPVSAIVVGWVAACVLAAPAADPLDPVPAPEPGQPPADTELSAHATPLYPRSGYLWPYAQGPSYAVEADRSLGQEGLLVTPVGTFRLDGGPLPIPSELAAAYRGGRTAYFVVQLDPTTLTAESRAALVERIESSGGRVLGSMPIAAFVARIPPQLLDSVRETPGVRAVEPYHPAFKLDPWIGRVPLADARRALSESYRLDVLLFHGEDAHAAAAQVEQLGGRLLHIAPDRLRVELHRSRLTELAWLGAVYRVLEHVPPRLQGQETTNAVQTGGIHDNANPFHDAGIRGAGQVLMVLDNGAQLDAADLSDTAVSPGTAGVTHRKVLAYETTEPFGGRGDDRGCDDPAFGGFTHGHVVSAVALGNPVFANREFRATDAQGNTWSLVGLAPDARLAFYDAGITPVTGSCLDPLIAPLEPGALFIAGEESGVLEAAHDDHGATVFMLPFGADVNSYGDDAEDVDAFSLLRPQALVVVPAGNNGVTYPYVPEPGTLTDLATSKNGLVIGASRSPDDHGSLERVNQRAIFSGTGPAGLSGRVAPLLMAPGEDAGSTGVASISACTTLDNDSTGAVQCEQKTGVTGTSLSAAGAAGAALLVRDYFARGFYPDGTDRNVTNASDTVDDLSGALVKAVLIASARFLGYEFLDNHWRGSSDEVSIRQRFNNEQGYGRIQLDRALPLADWAASPSGLLVTDVGLAGGAHDLPGLGRIDAIGGDTHSSNFEVCDDSQELRIALAWMDSVSDGLINDLDLELLSPSGKLYFGNYFSDDIDGDGQVHPQDEDCPSRFDDGTPADGGWDRSAWSLETCLRGDPPVRPPHDSVNPTEAIFLSPNPEGRLDAAGQPILRGGTCSYSGNACGHDGHCFGGESCLGGTAQVEAGWWTVRVAAKSGGDNAVQGYAVVVSGGVCRGSAVRLDRTAYACADEAAFSITERDEAADPASGLTENEIAQRTTLEVVATGRCADGMTPCDGPEDCSDLTCHAELVLDFEPAAAIGVEAVAGDPLRFMGSVPLGNGTFYDSGNGLLDVRHGDRVRLVYADETLGQPDPDKRRTATAAVDCRTRLLSGSVVFEQFGADADHLVLGGCETSARDLFEYGFPDRYMDAGEAIGYRIAFASLEDTDLEQVEVELSCVGVDADSPADCRPGTAACADPERRNNPPCTELVIPDPRQTIGLIPPRSATSANFQLFVSDALGTATPKVELLLRVRGRINGRTAESLVIQRHRLNVDEVSRYYSTDFPQGGVEILDRDNNGLIENPRTTGLAGFPTAQNTDYWFETRTWSDLTAGIDADGGPVPRNSGLQSPWNFDTGDGGFTTGLTALSDDGAIEEVIAQWGEDKNFNNVLDGHCEASPGRPCNRYPRDAIGCGFDCPECGDNDSCISDEDRDPQNTPLPLLDQNWSANGGCGWQTKAPGSCSEDAERGCYSDADCEESCSGPGPETGGIWHTGRISEPTIGCMTAGSYPGSCQFYETIGGTDGELQRVELLVTPEMQKVNQQLDADGEPLATIQILDFAWNQAIDIPDNNASWSWELDTDLDRLEPVDLKSDHVFLRRASGPFGAVTYINNPNLTRGFGMFAPLDPATGLSANGSVGNDRQGRNACFFEGGAVPNDSYGDIGLAGPPDDDLNEGYCPSGWSRLGTRDPHVAYCTTVCSEATHLSCGTDDDCAGTCVNPGLSGFCDNAPTFACTEDAECSLGSCVDVVCNGECIGGVCTNTGDSCDTAADCTEACVFSNTEIDEYVRPNGPVRNFEMKDWNGPDMRFEILEDRYGPTGNRFQASIGFTNYEVQPDDNEAEAGFGLAVDDVVVSWREFTLEQDAWSCESAGACALIELQQNNLYEGKTIVEISVIDATPTPNDCDLDGVSDETRDCNGNGIDDVVVELKSYATDFVSNVVLVLDRVRAATYAGSLPISTAYPSPGTLSVAPDDVGEARIRATYLDRDDGSGQPCRNSIASARTGLIEHWVTLLLTPADLRIGGHSLADNGDNDGWADDGETVTLRVQVDNTWDRDVTHLRLYLESSSPEIACITRPALAFGDLATGENRFSEAAFEFVVGEVGRTDALAEHRAEFHVRMEADQFHSLAQPLPLFLDLDLDAVGGSGPTSYFESFENGFGTFTTMHLDEELNPPDSDLDNHEAGVLNSDGHRCQYSDPDWRHAASYGSSQGSVCYLNPNGQPDAYWFHVVDERGFSGTRAMHFGAFVSPEVGYTTPISQLEAVRSTDPINLGWERACSVSQSLACSADLDCPSGESCFAASPRLSMKHQVAMVGHRLVGAQHNRVADRNVTQLQLADGAGDPVGHWIKIYPFVNVYDSQANSNYFNCTFDPIDDGNDESSFFDPSDPLRSMGPSSTCSPEFSFGWQGNTFDPFDPTELGRAPDGPGLEGESGPGTWIEPQFDLARFRGRRIRLRFLSTGLKLGGTVIWDNAFSFNPSPIDDGWFIDDVEVTQTLTEPATVTADLKENSHLPGCGTNCGQVEADLTLSPTALAAPGRRVELDASASTMDRCIGGVLQFRFWLDTDRSGAVNSGADSLLRDWSDEARLPDAPRGDVVYLVEARCSSDTACRDAASVTLDVACPTGPGGLADAVSTDNPFLGSSPHGRRQLLFSAADRLAWPVAATVDLIRGDLSALRGTGSFDGTLATCLLDNATDSVFALDGTIPVPGAGFYYLGRSALYCNTQAGGSWGSPARDAQIGADPLTCPP